MSRAQFGRIVLVMVLLAPLVIVQIGPGYAPGWFAISLAGVPVSIWATVGWFFTTVSLAWYFASSEGAAS